MNEKLLYSNNIKLFIRFLKEFNCKQEFINELKKTNSIFKASYTIESLMGFCNKNKKNIFNYVIIPSKENIYFWNDIAINWNKFIINGKLYK